MNADSTVKTTATTSKHEELFPKKKAATAVVHAGAGEVQTTDTEINLIISFSQQQQYLL